ncbi:MAG: MlaE family ABC transporter permease [Candidatus Babeliales bacterium]
MLISNTGRFFLKACNATGSFILFLGHVLRTFFSEKPPYKKILHNIESIGIHSLPIVLLTGTFSGAVLALQSYLGFKRFGGQDFIGPIVALTLTRELGPVLTGLMVTGRAGSSIAAEIGTMKITEQIDALRTMNINIWHYLMVPRIVAATFIVPFLSLIAMLMGILGGYFVCTYILHINSHLYILGIQKHIDLFDIISGLIKSAFFGLIFSWVGCYKGYKTYGGAQGVGKATTQTVVLASVMILIANYFLTALLFGL